MEIVSSQQRPKEPFIVRIEVFYNSSLASVKEALTKAVANTPSTTKLSKRYLYESACGAIYMCKSRPMPRSMKDCLTLVHEEEFLPELVKKRAIFAVSSGVEFHSLTLYPKKSP